MAIFTAAAQITIGPSFAPLALLDNSPFWNQRDRIQTAGMFTNRKHHHARTHLALGEPNHTEDPLILASHVVVRLRQTLTHGQPRTQPALPGRTRPQEPALRMISKLPTTHCSGHDLLRIWLKSCWCIVQDLVRIVPLYSAHWPRTATSLPRGSNPASNSNRGTCDASRSHRSVHTAGPSQIASSTHQQPSPIMAFRARSLPIKGSRFASKLITSHCSAAIASRKLLTRISSYHVSFRKSSSSHNIPQDISWSSHHASHHHHHSTASCNRRHRLTCLAFVVSSRTQPLVGSDVAASLGRTIHRSPDQVLISSRPGLRSHRQL